MDKKIVNIIFNNILIFVLAFLYTVSMMDNKSGLINFLIIFALTFLIIYFIWDKLDKIKKNYKSNNKPLLKKRILFLRNSSYYSFNNCSISILSGSVYVRYNFTMESSSKWRK